MDYLIKMHPRTARLFAMQIQLALADPVGEVPKLPK